MASSPVDGDTDLSPTVVALYGIWAHWAYRDENDIPLHVGKAGFLAFAQACPDLITHPSFSLSDVAAVYDVVANGGDGLNMEDFVAALQVLAVERFPHYDEGTAYSILLAFHVFRTPNIPFSYLLADLAASSGSASVGLAEAESPQTSNAASSGRDALRPTPPRSSEIVTPPRSPSLAEDAAHRSTTTSGGLWSSSLLIGRHLGDRASLSPGAATKQLTPLTGATIVRSTLARSLPPATARRTPYVLVARQEQRQPSPLSSPPRASTPPSTSMDAQAVSAAGALYRASVARRRSEAAADDAVASAAAAATAYSLAASAAAIAVEAAGFNVSPAPHVPAERVDAASQVDIVGDGLPLLPDRILHGEDDNSNAVASADTTTPSWSSSMLTTPPPPPASGRYLRSSIGSGGAGSLEVTSGPRGAESVGSQTLNLNAAAALAAASTKNTASTEALVAKSSSSTGARVIGAASVCCQVAFKFLWWLVLYSLALTVAHVAVTTYPGVTVAAVAAAVNALPPALREHAPLRVVEGCLVVGRSALRMPICDVPVVSTPASLAGVNNGNVVLSCETTNCDALLGSTRGRCGNVTQEPPAWWLADELAPLSATYQCDDPWGCTSTFVAT